MTPEEKKLNTLRNEIDQLDRRMFLLLKKRFFLVKKIGKIKAIHNLPIIQKNRLNAMLKQHLKQNKKLKLDSEFIESLIRLIHRESVKIQKLINKR